MAMNQATIDVVMRLHDRATRPAMRAFRHLDRVTRSYTRSLLNLRRIMGATMGAAGLGYLAQRAVDIADTIAKTADRLGVSTDALQELRFAADLAGVSQAKLDSSLERFTKRLGEAAHGTGGAVQWFERLNIELVDAAGNVRGADEVFREAMRGLAGLETASERAAAAAALFGREGVGLVNLVKDGAPALEKMRQRAHELGIVLSEDLLRSAEDTKDRLSILGAVVKSKLTAGVLTFAPVINAVADAVLNITRNIDALVDRGRMKEWAEEVGESVTGAFSRAVETVKGLKTPLEGLVRTFRALLDGFQALPTWMKEIGIFGALVGGVRGRFLLLAMAATAERIKTDALFFKARSEGIVGLKDWFLNSATTDFDSLSKLIEERAGKDVLERLLGVGVPKNVFVPPPEPPPAQGTKLHFVGSMKRPQGTPDAHWMWIDPTESAERWGEMVREQADKIRALTDNATTNPLRRLKEVSEEDKRIISEVGEWVKKWAAWKAQAEKDWTDAAIKGITSYRDNALDTYDEVRSAVEGAFLSMEDALVRFVETGKLSFKSFADSIISDMSRIAIRAQITGPLAQMFGGFFGAPALATPAAPTSTPFPSSGPSIGGSGWWNAPAPRVAPRTGAGTSGKGPIGNVTVINNGAPEVGVTVSERAGPGGVRDIEVLIDRTVAGAIDRGGDTAQAIQRVFGLTRRGY